MPALFFNYAVLAAALDGDFDAALKLGEEGVRRFTDESALLVNVGAIQEHCRHHEVAENLLLKAVALPDPPPQAHKILGDYAYERGDLAGARAHFERAVKLDPRLGDDVYFKLGEIAYSDDDLDWAGMLWKRALEMNPQNAAARSAMERLGATKGS